MMETKHKKFPVFIRQVVAALEISVSQSAVERFCLYVEEIMRWSRRTNLTGAGGSDAFIQGPLYDALTLIPVLETTGSLVDVGSGGGLPGIPAALLTPGLKITLVEPREKRIIFLKHVSHLLGLDLEIVQARAEDLSRESWDAAVAQAVWPAQVWLQRAADLVRPGGAIYAMTSTAIVAADTPAHIRIELEKRFHRPVDGAARFATRLRKIV